MHATMVLIYLQERGILRWIFLSGIIQGKIKEYKVYVPVL